ncbi:hypothetical protein roselon_02344 [Roseibacterium elongatum DSM 19469]|uniref:Uncharacterized protein n=1 Tax=Roseicyclus elongatus DSM 19469 TaxID=1294273 RepID=W8S394_9RHOB|nr:hypothetical protein [Roseibacterium elongatum]AHM04677.1 hypothetical protein roselon_02344 [Roseibacterium elongatum DSM 19469]
MTASDILTPAWESSRTVALALIAGFARKTGFSTLESRVDDLPLRGQAVIVGLTLALLLGCSLFAAQFGLLGFALFLGAVVVIVG